MSFAKGFLRVHHSLSKHANTTGNVFIGFQPVTHVTHATRIAGIADLAQRVIAFSVRRGQVGPVPLRFGQLKTLAPKIPYGLSKLQEPQSQM